MSRDCAFLKQASAVLFCSESRCSSVFRRCTGFQDKACVRLPSSPRDTVTGARIRVLAASSPPQGPSAPRLPFSLPIGAGEAGWMGFPGSPAGRGGSRPQNRGLRGGRSSVRVLPLASSCLLLQAAFRLTSRPSRHGGLTARLPLPWASLRPVLPPPRR